MTDGTNAHFRRDRIVMTKANSRARYRALHLVPLLLVLVLLAYTIPLGWPDGVSVFGVAFSVACAAAAAGSLIGFLFGIPVRGGDDVRNQDGDLPYRGNTSLEQISDWLVKILVGVGLVQLTTFAPALGQMFDSIGTAIGGTPRATLLAGAVVIVSAVWGFMFSYLSTRTSLPQILTASEATERVEELDLRVDQLEESIDRRTRVDADALRLAHIVMSHQGVTPQVADEQLKSLLVQSSAGALTEIYIKATDRRRTIRRLGEQERQNVGGVIRIFQLLIEAGDQSQSHRYHGQLGLALMEKLPADFSAAEGELSQAIRSRPATDRASTRFYEWNRALCKIRILELDTVKPSDQEVNQIIEDLRIADGDSDLRRRSEGDVKAFSRDFDEEVSRWLTTNNLWGRLRPDQS